MFRRKEEGEHDLLSDVAAAGSQNGSGEYNSTEASESTGSAKAASPGYNAATPSIRGSDTAKTPAYRGASAPELTRSRIQSAAAASSMNLGASADKSGKASRRILTVGNDILLKGEIATCDRLVIEGEVDATLNDVHTVEIAETGSFKGSAEIEDAEISGVFEGELVVRNRLVIYSTGQVHGKITYGEIEIERGGELTGDIQTIGAASAAAQQKSGKKAAA